MFTTFPLNLLGFGMNNTIKPKEEFFPSKIANDIFIKGKNNIKVFRQYRKMTQSELAKKTDISLERIKELENGKKAKITELRKIAKALDILTGMIE